MSCETLQNFGKMLQRLAGQSLTTSRSAAVDGSFAVQMEVTPLELWSPEKPTWLGRWEAEDRNLDYSLAVSRHRNSKMFEMDAALFAAAVGLRMYAAELSLCAPDAATCDYVTYHFALRWLSKSQSTGPKAGPNLILYLFFIKMGPGRNDRKCMHGEVSFSTLRSTHCIFAFQVMERNRMK